LPEGLSAGTTDPLPEDGWANEARPASSPLRRAVRNAGYLFTGKGVSAVLGFITTALAARALGLADLGILLLLHSFAGAASSATRLQSWQPLLQFGSKMFHAQERREFQTLLRHSLLLDLGGAVAAVALGMPIGVFAAHWLGWQGHGTLAAVYVTCALFMNTGAVVGLMRLSNRYELAALADVAAAGVRLAGAVAGFVLHWRLRGFLAVWYGSVVAAFAIDALLLYELSRSTPSLHGFRLAGAWRSRAAGFWRLVISTSGNQALIGLSSRLCMLVVGAALGPTDAALYRITAQLGEAMSQPAQLLTPALYPEFVHLRDNKNWRTLRRIVGRVMFGLAGFSLLALPLAALVGPWLLSLWIGVRETGVMPLILLMAGAALVDLWDVPLEPLLAALGRARALVYGRLWAMLPGIPLLYLLARQFGVDGAAVASLLQELGIFFSRLLPLFAMR
jgi:O-antigen/teichoic acid export membrane protein